LVEKLDPKELVSVEELIGTLVYAQEAFVRLLERNGILTKREVLG